jgi:hypothetical protein
METTKNNLPPHIKKFFHNLSDYLDTKLYYFGSVQRSDYVPGKSDIDVDIFTENEKSIMGKLQHFLHVNKSDFQPIIWIIDDKDVTYGYKLKYENLESNIIAEFSIYNEKFKNVIVKEHNRKIILPFYITIMLYILKSFYYTIPILPKKLYSSCKRFILSICLGEGYPKFMVLKNI